MCLFPRSETISLPLDSPWLGKGELKTCHRGGKAMFSEKGAGEIRLETVSKHIQSWATLMSLICNCSLVSDTSGGGCLFVLVLT